MLGKRPTKPQAEKPNIPTAEAKKAPKKFFLIKKGNTIKKPITEIKGIIKSKGHLK